MLLILLATFCVTLTAGRVIDGEFTPLNDDDTFVMPEKYKTKATKTVVSSNFIEEFEFWRSDSSGRQDCNHGYYKKIYFPDAANETIQYQIYPTTDKDLDVEYVCNTLQEPPSLDMPELQDIEFENQGNDSVLGHQAVRFESVEYGDSEDEYMTLWAAQDTIEDDIQWIPIRYEVKAYNSVLGSFTKHVIWDFYDFELDFDEEEVLSIEEYQCEDSNTVRHTLDSEAVTKELMFMNPENENHVNHVFNSFKSKYNMKYAHEQEHKLRKNIFKQNMRMIASVNSQNLGFKLGVNKFADRTSEEKKKTGYRKRAAGAAGNTPFPYTEESLKTVSDQLPKDVDLRTQGLVSAVKDQMDCGSCWTFGTTAAVEGALARANGGRLLSLANQALVDCVWGFGASGCEGGSDNAAYEWMMEYGLPTVEEYGEYENKDGLCHIHNMTKLYPIKGYTDVTPNNKMALKVAIIEHGPLSVSIDASDMIFHYSSGVYVDSVCNPHKLNHEVTLVGYGEHYGELYWIVRNSWGPYWGEEGYILISAKRDCGITTEPTYVVF